MGGIYSLVIKVEKKIDVNVGTLGKLSFPEGLYAYVGSAQTNLESRVKRHLRKNKTKFWHIDYLLARPESKIVKTFMVQAGKNYECVVARKIAERGKPVASFGCSDCNCKSHLVRIDDHNFLGEIMRELDPEDLAEGKVASQLCS